MKQRPVIPVLILIGHIALGLAFNVATPVFEAPDEANHFLYVRYLQRNRTLPVQGTDQDGPRAHHPPGYFALGALLTAWVPLGNSTDLPGLEMNPYFANEPRDGERSNRAIFTHPMPGERWPWRGMALSVRLIRLLSLLFSTLAVWLTYWAARGIRPNDEAFAILSTGLLAFNPEVLFMSGVINNDTAALAAGAATVYLLGRFSMDGFTPARWMLVGVVVSLGLLAKSSVLVLFVPVGWVLLLESARGRAVRPFVLGLMSLLLPIALLTGWWFIRNHLLYGDWTGNSSIIALWRPVLPEERLEILSMAPHLFLTGMLGRFGVGLGVVTYPGPVYIVAGPIAVLALGGALRSCLGALPGCHGTDRPRPAPKGRLWAVHSMTVAGVFVAATAYLLTVYSAWYGRYSFPAYPSLALLLAVGLLAWFRLRWHPFVGAFVVFVNLALSLYGLFGLVIPAYAPPRSPSSAELQRMVTLDADVGNVARVLGYELDRSEAAPGGVLTIKVYWLPQRQTERPYTVFVHLYSPEVGSIAQRDTYPGLGNYATTVWEPGRPFVDTYRLYLSADAPEVGDAGIVLGLYDRDTMVRLPVTGADASPENDWIEFGNIRISAGQDTTLP